MNLKELKQNDSVNTKKKASSTPKISFSLDNKPAPRTGALQSFNIGEKRKKRFGWLKTILIIVLLIAVGAGSYGGYVYYLKFKELESTGIKDVNILDPLKYVGNLANKNIEEDPLSSLNQSEGKTNFLLLGVDARFGFESFRTDSIIVASYDHKTKDVVEISVPRDMQAKYYNTITKINAIFQFTWNENKSAKKSDEVALQNSFDALTKSIKTVTGLDIHYGVMVNFRALKDIVDNLGGITVNVEQDLWDNLYPNDSDTGVITIYFKKGVTEMNGTKALQYARSRETTTDFDRAKRQQKVINAIKDKFLSLNPVDQAAKVNSVLSIISKNVKFFNINSGTIETLVGARDLLRDVKTYNIVLDPTIGSSVGSVLKGGQPYEGAGYLVYPANGKGDFSELQNIVQMYLGTPKLLSEDANVVLIRTNSKRYKDFTTIGQYFLDKNLPFIMNYTFIEVKPSATSTPSTSPTATPVSTEKTVNFYVNGEFPVTTEFYEKLLKDNGIIVVKKNSADLPKELSKVFKETNVLIVVD